MNDFAEQLFEALNKLQVECAKVRKDCQERKARLEKAIIWNKVGEDELMELAASKEADLMASFYNKLGSGCVNWYTAASKKFAQD